MGLENRRSGNASEGSNPSLSAISGTIPPILDDNVSRDSRSVPTARDGAKVGTPLPCPTITHDLCRMKVEFQLRSILTAMGLPDPRTMTELDRTISERHEAAALAAMGRG